MSPEKTVVIFLIIAAGTLVAGGFAIDGHSPTAGACLFLVALIALSIAHAVAKTETEKGGR